jgi:arylsulfatase A-like enzyme
LSLVERALGIRWWVVLALICGCSQPEESATEHSPDALARSVLLVTWDTVRADRTSPYGYGAARTPVLQRLADEGIVYEQAYAATPITLPSHASILTGVYPTAHGVHDNRVFCLKPEAVTVSEVLQDKGLRTAAFVGSFILDSRWGLDQGYEIYDGPSLGEMGEAQQITERPANEVVDAALEWFAGVEPSEAFFCWVHFYDPHHPYEPPGLAVDDPVEVRYDGEIAFCDQQMGRLLEGLGSRGLRSELAVIVTADHGEAFGDHGEDTHGLFLYEETMRVPLLLRLPGDPRRRRRAEAVSTTAIAPTVMQLLGFAGSGLEHAQVPSLLAEGASVARPIYLETELPYHSFRWHASRAVVSAGFKAIEAREAELYALSDDPAELNNLAAQQSDRLQQMLAQLQELIAQHEDLGWGRDESLPTSPEELQALQDLGYTGTHEAGRNPYDPQLIPAQQGLQFKAQRGRFRALLSKARELNGDDARLRGENPKVTAEDLRQAQQMLAEALEICKSMRAANPLDPTLDSAHGMIELSRNNHAGAIEPLEAALVKEPRSASDHYNLAVCYSVTGKHEWGVREMLKVLTLEPRMGVAHKAMIKLYGDLKEWGRMVWFIENYLSHFDGAAAERQQLERLLQQARGSKEQAGMSVTSPEDFPVQELLPEGYLHR